MAIGALAYPAGRRADVVLRDGSTATIRPVCPEDEVLLQGFYEALSPESRYMRFFSGAVNFEQAAASASHLDYHDRFGLIATTGMDGAVIANAMYIKTAGDRAEVAFAVSDPYQGHGLGTLLLDQLAEAAHRSGILVFEAVVLPGNHQMMMDVFRPKALDRSRGQPQQNATHVP